MPPISPIGSISPYAAAAQSVREFSSSARLSKADAPEQFEAFVLQSFIEEMLPKSADSVFGQGLAGDYWKSMLAEHISLEIAEHGGIGIAALIRSEQIQGLKGKLSSIPAPQPSFGDAPSAAESLASGPPVSLRNILGD